MVSLQKFLRGFNPEVRTIILAIRELILKVNPALIETMNPQHIAYRLSEKTKDPIIVITPLKSRVHLGFYQGSQLPDPKKLLQGNDPIFRHVIFTNAEETADLALYKLIETAIVIHRQRYL
ncbi:MAG: DUF1801 domain-containing protein [Candidatus Ranarchaeia archaeon]